MIKNQDHLNRFIILYSNETIIHLLSILNFPILVEECFYYPLSKKVIVLICKQFDIISFNYLLFIYSLIGHCSFRLISQK